MYSSNSNDHNENLEHARANFKRALMGLFTLNAFFRGTSPWSNADLWNDTDLWSDSEADFKWDKGSKGEESVYDHLLWLGEKNIFRDLYIPTKEGNYSQIDLLVVTSTGIVVIESKNYSGWIFGSEHQTQWTQTFRNGQKFKLYNPIKQNQGHIYALSSFLGLNAKDDFHSCILFGSECELMDVPDDSDTFCILQEQDLRPYMKYIHEKKSPRFSPQQIKDITTQLNSLEEASQEVKAAHKEYVQHTKEEFERKKTERTYQRTTQTKQQHTSYPPPHKQTTPPPNKQAPPPSSQPDLQIHLKAHLSHGSGVGGWSAVIQDRGVIREIHSKVAPPTNLNRTYLYGFLDSLQLLKHGTTLSIYSDCGYLLANLPRTQVWQQNNWEVSEGNYVANADLWAQILSLTKHLQIKTQLIQKSDHFGDICSHHAQWVTENKPIPPLSSYQ